MTYLFIDRIGAHAIWRVLTPVADALAAKGERVMFVRWNDGSQREPLPPPVGVETVDIYVPKNNLIRQGRVFTKRFLEVLRAIQPEVVHTNFTVPGALARRAAKRAGVPWVVTTQHELYGSMSPHLRLLTRLTERHADQIVYVSQTVARSFGRDAPLLIVDGPPSRHVVIHNGIDTNAFAAARGSDCDRVPGRILCTGRLVPVKGYDQLLRALPQIVKEHPQAHVRLAGSGPDELRLRQLAADLGIKDRVEFLGWIDRCRMLKELGRSSVVAIPSDGTQEGFGLVAAEAMAAGVPVVASRIPVFEEVLGPDGECARLFNPGDVDNLADTIVTTLADAASAYTRRDRALARVKLRFSATCMADRYLQVYARLCPPALHG